jgi:alkylhydroperoxidase family enzyme
MSTDPRPQRLPTLTEVVDVNAPAPRPLPSEDELRKQILADVQRQVEQMLEVRLREALTPALTRLTDALVRDARGELASSLRDMVARAVAQELSRHRDS